MKKVLAGITLLCACVASAQTSPDCAAKIPLTVWLPTQRPLNLARVKVGKQQINGFRLDKTVPRRFVLVLDASGSMSDTGIPYSPPLPEGRAWSMETELAEAIVNAAPSSTSARLITVGASSDSSQFTQDRAVVLQQISAAAKQLPKGKTALYDTIEQAAQLFGQPQDGDYIIVISDGGDNASNVSLKRIEQLLIARGIRLFVIAPTLNRPATNEELEAPINMQQLSQNTGGMFIDADRIRLAKEPPARKKDDLSKIANLTQSVAQDFYLLRVTAASTVKREKLDIKLPATSKGQPLLYPRFMEPCVSN